MAARYRPDMADMAVEHCIKEFMFGKSSGDRHILQMIQEAPRRIEDKSYGCVRCSAPPPSFPAGRSFGHYRGELAAVRRSLKSDGRENAAGVLAPLMVHTFWESWQRSSVHLVVAVPLHTGRLRERGFNQAGLLAAAVAKLLGITAKHKVLRRSRPTRPQVGLTEKERQENVRNAFLCNARELLAGGRVLLVDDVMTTGATLDAATRAVLKGGASCASVLTAARAVPGGE